MIVRRLKRVGHRLSQGNTTNTENIGWLFPYRFHIVSILLPYWFHVVFILFPSYFHIFPCCFYIVSVLFSCCFHNVSILFPCCFYFVFVLFSYCYIELKASLMTVCDTVCDTVSVQSSTIIRQFLIHSFLSTLKIHVPPPVFYITLTRSKSMQRP